MITLHNYYRSLANTGIKVSPIGLGTVKIGRDEAVKYPTHFQIPNDNEVKTLLVMAQELGINTLDTAPAYGNSEERLGKLLTNRHDWVIVSKAGEEFKDGKSTYNFSSKHIVVSVERSLKRLNTDYLDVLLIHSNGNDLAIIKDDELWTTLTKLKQKGLIRSFGLSSKTIEGGMAALQKSDCAMVTYNITAQAEKPVLDFAKQHNKGIFIKKALASGHLCVESNKSPLEANFELIFSHPSITSVIIGTINSEHIKQNVAMAVKCLRQCS